MCGVIQGDNKFAVEFSDVDKMVVGRIRAVVSKVRCVVMKVKR